MVVIHRAEGRTAKPTRPEIEGDAPSSGYTYLDELYNYVDDGTLEASEIKVRFHFLDTGGTTHATGLYEISLSAGGHTSSDLDYQVFGHVLPDSSDLYVQVRYYEDDGGVWEFYGDTIIRIADNDQMVSIYKDGSPTTQVAEVRLIWQVADPQQLDTLVFNVPTYHSMEENTSETVVVKGYDPNGYHISFTKPSYLNANISSRSSDNTSVATIGAPESDTNLGANLTLSGTGLGSTWIHVTANLRGAVSDSFNISVYECMGGICPESGGGGDTQ